MNRHGNLICNVTSQQTCHIFSVIGSDKNIL